MTSTKTVNIALLQGGGAHGAFTWGALDRLIEAAAVELEGINATSAGAMTPSRGAGVQGLAEPG